MWSDAETDVDFLNYSEVAELVTEIINDESMLPISIGIFGGWGTGKSTTLKLVEGELSRQVKPPLIIKFDAWLYQDFDDARAALMSVIASALLKAAPPTLKEKASNLIKRVNKLRMLGLAAEAGALAMGVPTFGVASKGVQALGDMFASNSDEADVDAVKAGASDLKGRVTGLVKPAESQGPPDEIDAFRREFGEVLTNLETTLVVFIDNLDRCLPPNAIHTLEAVRLFLFLPKTAFVIAADEDMIRHAVLQHFNNPAERHVSDYLDKLIQMPVRVPRVGMQEVRAYLFLLLAARGGVKPDRVELIREKLIESMRLSWKGGSYPSVDSVMALAGPDAGDDLRQSLDMADRMAPLLAHSGRVLGNPRIVKRLLNVVRMRASIARKRAMPLDEALIAKLALFERCTDEATTEALHTAINSARDGAPDVLKFLEKETSDADLKNHVPEPWAKHLPFLKDWASLEPRLTGVDLRPAVYLARETVPLKISSSGSSPVVIKAVETLLKVPTVSSVAGRQALDAVPEGDHPLVMEAMISEIRKNSEWGRSRADFRGALIIAERNEPSAALLARFIRSLQLTRQPAWMSAMLKDAKWWNT